MLLEKMDHVSSLPDGVLCHILSFLTTKEAALTSILCKRWRNLLSFVPNLDIDDSVFLRPEEGKEDRYDIQQSFMEFVDRVLALQGNSPIKKFSLKFRTCFDSSHRVDGWISNALARGVSELDLLIILYRRDYFLLSSKCFKSRNLVTLKLNSVCVDWLAAGDVFLPMLKTLVLHSVRLCVDKFFFRALPALEELVLFAVSWGDRDVTVSNASLKTLTMKYCLGTFSLDTPSLVYFCFSEYVAIDYPVVIMQNLFEARISLLVTEEQIERARAPNIDWVEDDAVLRLVNVEKLMKGIRNVQYLNLSPNTLEVLSLCCESMPVFNNLKLLTLKSHKSRGWQAMPVLLRNCPHLETLVLEGLLHHVTDKCGYACDCVSQEDKGHSVTSCPVKVLEVKGFRTIKEMHMIKHFMNYFSCLKETNIYIEENGSRQLRVPQVSEVIAEMMEHYEKSSSVQLLVGGSFYKKWTAQ
ncbi:FBD domain [Arabidopsis thaliana x Arabidopsis arenosa]|uniref:FBD domain n=1 Tax=Arabidopsis thaliana x Arabidopsis arenosa TaxID=1240361 RepID=A0A8T1YCG7_9BRAS|nr:FBD domain [Arabidopsis thaliana x Arabidopsis arenosa]